MINGRCAQIAVVCSMAKSDSLRTAERLRAEAKLRGSNPAATFRQKPSWARLGRTDRYELVPDSPAQAASPTSKRSGIPGGSVRRAAVHSQSRTVAMAVAGCRRGRGHPVRWICSQVSRRGKDPGMNGPSQLSGLGRAVGHRAGSAHQANRGRARSGRRGPQDRALRAP
jgi:hypothetical protein